MNRLFDDAARGGLASAGSGATMTPHMDVSETDSGLRLDAELPGVAEKDIEIDLSGDMLTIRAEKRQEGSGECEGLHVGERSFGIFQRSLRLPFPVDADQVQARLENGVLSVNLPRRQAQERSRRIAVQAGPPQASGDDAVPEKGGEKGGETWSNPTPS